VVFTDWLSITRGVWVGRAPSLPARHRRPMISVQTTVISLEIRKLQGITIN
jgi:hypothetical protein